MRVSTLVSGPSTAPGPGSTAPAGAAREDHPTRLQLVVVGNGMVGHRFCEALVQRGADRMYDIVVFGEEPRVAYDRVHLTDCLTGRSPDELSLAGRDWYREHGIELHTNHRVTAIDREGREVVTDGGIRWRYDKLVLATGSLPFVPPVEGTALPGVFVYRTIDDLVAIRRHSAVARSAAVIGGGLLGLEAARALDQLGVDCQVIEYAPHVLVAQLDEAAGRLAGDQIEQLGIRVHSNLRLHRIRDAASTLVLEFGDDRDPITVDMVVVAAGIRPRIDLAEEAELDTGEIGGIVVNDHLETSDPDIHAIGECAAHRGRTYGLVAPGYRMAEALARSLTGRPTRFEGADMSTRLKVLGLDVAVIGDFKQPGRILTWSGDGQHRRLVLRGDRLIGASALGDWPEVRRMQDAVRVLRYIWPWQVQRFLRHGRLWRESKATVVSWSDTATVCNCMNVSCGTLKQAIAGGCSTPDELAVRTGASTLCGSCRPLLATLTGSVTTPVGVPGSGILAGTAVFVLIAMLGAVFLGPIPYLDSVQTSIGYDVLWRDGVWRQVSGFTLLGVSLLGLTMSIRKRWRRLRLGDFGIWRAAHAVIGVLGLGVLAVHTGLRVGDNLNFALMTAFVGTNLAGALAGFVTGSAAGATRAGLRRWLTWAHIVFVWPLPVLVAFHILTAYLF